MSDGVPREPHNSGALPRFSVIVELCEKLEGIYGQRSQERRRQVIVSFYQWWRQHVGNDIFPAMRLLLPQVDSEIRQLYLLQEKRLGKLLAKALGLAPVTAEYKNLVNYRSDTRMRSNFADIAYETVLRRSTIESWSNLDLGQLAEVLRQLSNQKQQEQQKTLEFLLSCMCAREMKWVFRIILRNMRLHVTEKVLLLYWHPDAVDLLNVTSNLEYVCHTLWDPTKSLDSGEREIQPMRCFKPMRTLFKKRALADFEGIRALMPEEGFFIEEKIDGERIQIHLCDRKLRYFSRRGQDFTDLYGGSLDSREGSLTPHLAKLLNVSQINRLILDGEMVAWDSAHDEICSLTKVKQAARSSYEGGRSPWRPLFMAFDCLHVNGKDLSNFALAQRKSMLERVLPPERRKDARGYIEILPYKWSQSSQSIREEFERLTKHMSEGLVVKNPLSRYITDARNDAWVKVKPEFMAGFEGENFDLAVLGGYRGAGHLSGLYSSYLMGLRRGSGTFASVCRVGSGFCTAFYEKIRDLTKDAWGPDRPHWMNVSKERADSYIQDPTKILIFEVKATQITESDRYGSGWSLRFPRFVTLRDDKGVEDCLTVADFEKYRLSNEQKPKPGKRVPSSDDEESAEQPKKKLVTPVVEIKNDKSHLFSGLRFFVAGDASVPRNMSILDLERLIKENGGALVRRPEPDAIAIADKRLARVATLIDSHKLVAHPRWLLDCCLNNRLLAYEPDHLLSAPPTDMALAKENVDKYGFSKTRLMSDTEVAEHLKNVDPVLKEDGLLDRAALEIASVHTGKQNRRLIFAGIRGYLVTEDDLIPEMLRYGGARLVSDPVEGDATHVICDGKVQLPDNLPQRPYLVKPQWVLDCWRELSTLEESVYRVDP